MFGQKEAEEADTDQLFESTGDFSVVELQKKVIKVYSDYFGIQKLYYYVDNNIFAISNRYHLLLMILVSTGISLEINEIVAVSTVIAEPIQLFKQVFTEDMHVKNIKLLSINQYIELGAKGYEIKNKPIQDILRKKNEVNNADYKTYLEKGKKDVLNNLKNVLIHPRFKYAIIDSTGGLDSRCVIAAATNFNEYKDKIRIRTREVKATPMDHVIGVAMANLFDYKFDDLTEYKYNEGIYKAYNEYFSVRLGVYFGNNIKGISAYRTEVSDAVSLWGMFGEICFRPYLSRIYFNTKLDNLDMDKFAQLLLFHDKNNVLGTKKRKKDFLNEFKKAMSEFPGETSLEKLDMQYLFLRNGLHCCDFNIFGLSRNVPRIAILQSKNYFYLKWNTYRKMNPIKLQLDAINSLNFVLSSLPFELDMDKKDQELMLQNEEYDNPAFKSRRTPLVEDTSKLEEANNRKEVKVIDSKEIKQISEIELRDFVLYCLRYLTFEKVVFDDETAKQIYFYLKKSEFEFVMCTKIMMLYYQMKLINSNEIV